MVSSRARKGRNLGTRINDLDRRTASAEAKARTPDIDAKGVEDRLSALEQTSMALMSSNFRSGQDQGLIAGGGPGVASYVLRGDTAARDSYYPNPATDTERVALANERPVWYNTDTGRHETYYTTEGLGGLTVPGLMAGTPSAWYGMPGEEWAAKSGPSAFVSNYKVSWSRGIDSADTLDGTGNSGGIRIRMTGVYECRAFMRGGTGTDYMGLALNGDRATFEARSTTLPILGVWTHDHPGGANNFAQSWYMGTLYSGDLITAGPQIAGTDIQLSSAASAGALYVRRIS